VAFTYLKVKSTKYLCLLPVVLALVLLFWSWSWSCKQRPLSWSCYFGLGLKNMVLFTSLTQTYLLLHARRRGQDGWMRPFDIEGAGMVWYGIVEFNVPLDTV